MRTRRSLADVYRFPGFRPSSSVRGILGEPTARILRLRRPGEKTRCGVCGLACRAFYDHTTRRVRDLSAGDARIYLEVEIRRVWCCRCCNVKRET